MTERYGPLYASFWEWDDPTYAVVAAPGGVTALAGITQASVDRKRGGIWRGRFTVVPQDDWSVLVRAGRIVSLYQYDRILGGDREMGAFLVEKVTPGVDQSGREVITVSGMGREHLLTKYRHFAPIGEEKIFTTALAAGASGPWTTTVAVGAPANNDSITLASSAGIQEGDELRIELDGGGTAVCQVTNAAPPGAPAGTVQMLPRLTDNASNGNEVEMRKANVAVADATGFAVGQKVEVDRDSGGAFTSVITTVNLDTGAVGLRDGLPSAAGVGKAVRAYDYSEPTTDDVTLIMAPAEGWELWVQGGATGTAEGTTHAPKGESVWELLTLAAEQSEEFFRVAPLEAGNRPRKKINWYQTADASGMSLFLYLESGGVATGTENVDIGIIYAISRSDEHNVLTRVYPSGADGRIDLAHCTAGAKAAAEAAGFSVVISNDPHEPDYVQYGPGVTEHGVLADVVRYGNIMSKTGTSGELQAAADAMLQQAMTTIRESQTREFWDVKCHTHRPLFPGQTVSLMNSSGLGPQANGTFYVLEVREAFEHGLIYSYLKLSKEPEARVTPGRAVAREMLTTKQAARRLDDVAGSGGSDRSVVVIDGGSSHEHAEFLKVDGSRALVGDMAVAAGKKIDGVDISAHAGDPAAHHSPAWGYDGSIEVLAGQALRVGAAFAGPGLAITGGVGAVNVAAAKGTTISDDQVGVAVAGDGGLVVGATGVGVKRPAHSGLAVDGGGVYLSPTAVGADTSNAVNGTGHTHGVLAYFDTKSAPGQLMKATTEGDHTLRWLTADKVRTPLVDTAAGALRLEPGGQLVEARGGLKFTGGARSVTTDTGSLTLRPAEELILWPVGGKPVEMGSGATLKTGHWASGFLGTGWGIQYDGHGDFRSIYADELHVAAFIADTARVKVGSEYITPGMGLLAVNFTIPNVGGTGILVLEDAPGLGNMPLFDNNDWVLVRVMNRAGGGLLVANAWGQVSGYADGPEEGQQSWVFTCRQTSAAGQAAAGGDTALGFGKSGAGWYWVTAIDPAGSPHAGITTWRGDNPYTDANRQHHWRAGQLKGVTALYEWGMWAGETGSRHVVFSDLRSEIHGSRLSLYAGDGAQLRVVAVEVRFVRSPVDGSTLVPNADHTILNIFSTGVNYMSTVDEGIPGSSADYIYNDTNTGGYVTLGLTEPSPWAAPTGVKCKVHLAGAGFVNDMVKLYGQVFAADEVTPLTSEVLLYTMSSNINIQTERSFDQVDTAATQAQWNGARLRLRWEYRIAVTNEAIRLDPQTPSIAVGQGLPTGYEAGGDGFWVGADAGLYKLRLGKANGVGLRWTGAAVELRNSANAPVIELASTGISQFAAPMTLGVGGGIWQGSGGSFAAPVSGFKLSNNAGKGKIEMFPASGAPVVLDENGLSVPTRTAFGAAGKNVNEITFTHHYLGTDYKAGALSGFGEYGPTRGSSSVRLYVTNKAGTAARAYVEAFHYEEGAANQDTLTLFSPDRIQMSAGDVRVDAFIDARQGLRSLAGLAIGTSSLMNLPPSGAIRFQERATGLPTVPAGYADIYLGTDHHLYFKLPGLPAVAII